MDLSIPESQIVTIDIFIKQNVPVMVYIYTPVIGLLYAAGYDIAAKNYIHAVKVAYHTHTKITKI